MTNETLIQQIKTFAYIIGRRDLREYYSHSIDRDIVRMQIDSIPDLKRDIALIFLSSQTTDNAKYFVNAVSNDILAEYQRGIADEVNALTGK